MDIVTVTPENLEEEHICCAIANRRDCQVAAKKDWMAARFADGLVFKKGNVRGKCFIEYLPAEKAFAPVDAPGYMYIDCLWVSGQFKEHGWARALLEDALADSREKGKHGMVVLSATGKRPFLSDPSFFAHFGFTVADTAAPDYTLLYLPFDAAAPAPRFRDACRAPHINEEGFVLYYTAQCPYTAKYVPLIEAAAREKGAPFHAIRLDTAADAQNAPTPFTTYTLFYNGTRVISEILSVPKFQKILAAHGY